MNTTHHQRNYQILEQRTHNKPKAHKYPKIALPPITFISIPIIVGKQAVPVAAPFECEF